MWGIWVLYARHVSQHWVDLGEIDGRAFELDHNTITTNPDIWQVLVNTDTKLIALWRETGDCYVYIKR